jgi:hypothetical protein
MIKEIYEFRIPNDFYFLVFAAIQIIMIITKPTRKNAHHIPALKIVSIAPHPLSTNSVKKRIKKKEDTFISCFYDKKSTIIPFYFCAKRENNTQPVKHSK